jgi:hypothetical protein
LHRSPAFTPALGSGTPTVSSGGGVEAGAVRAFPRHGIDLPDHRVTVSVLFAGTSYPAYRLILIAFAFGVVRVVLFE